MTELSPTALGSRAGLDKTRAVLVAEPARDEVTIEVRRSFP